MPIFLQNFLMTPACLPLNNAPGLFNKKPSLGPTINSLINGISCFGKLITLQSPVFVDFILSFANLEYDFVILIVISSKLIELLFKAAISPARHPKVTAIAKMGYHSGNSCLDLDNKISISDLVKTRGLCSC